MAGKVLRFMTNNAVGFLALFIALGGVGYAASGGFTSGGKLAACVNEEGRLKLLKSGERCKRGQKSVSWSQTGPAGAKGAPGAPGAPGGPGAAGPTGSSGTSAVSLWARVGNGVLEAGNGALGLKSELSGSIVEVTFNRDVRSCGAQATINNGPANQVIASSTEGATPNAATVIMAKNGSLSPGSFTLSIIC